MRTVALWRQNRKEKRQVGHCETMFINVDELRIIFGVGLGSIELGPLANRKMRQIHVIEGQYIRSNCHYELS
jgi:hypothetical protein